VSQLFIELYLDEDVSVLVADLLRARGFVATTTQEAGNLGSSDRVQLESAIKRAQALLTHNRADFEALAREFFSSGRSHNGIIVAVRRPPNDIVKRLLAILNSVTSDEIENQIRYL
jgi:predicted nuclease of predicted toxin-antitoxin system